MLLPRYFQRPVHHRRLWVWPMVFNARWLDKVLFNFHLHSPAASEKRLTPAPQFERNSRGYTEQNQYADSLAVKTIQAQQRLLQNSTPYTGGLAAEPGLDYNAVDVEGFDNYAEVTVTDYSSEQISISDRLDTSEKMEEFFKSDRPNWAKVRWINVDGLNWKYIKFLAIKYSLHRLAIEDLLSVQRTKIDTYKHRTCLILFHTNRADIYVCLLMHALIGENDRIVVDDTHDLNRFEPQPDTTLFSKIEGLLKRHQRAHDKDAESRAGSIRRGSLPIAQHYNPDRSLIYDHVKSMRESGLTVNMEQVSLFLTDNGTVLSFFQVFKKLSRLTLGERQNCSPTNCAAIEITIHASSN
jgi:hypothetical protein